MLRYLSLVAVLLAALLVACQQASNGQKSLSEAERTEIEQAVMQRVNKLIDVAEKVDTAWITSMLAKKGDVRMGNQATLYKSADEILADFGPEFKNFRSQEIELTYSNTTVLAPELALFSGEGKFTATDTSGVTSPEYRFVWTFVLVAEEGDWKFMQLHQSFALAK